MSRNPWVSGQIRALLSVGPLGRLICVSSSRATCPFKHSHQRQSSAWLHTGEMRMRRRVRQGSVACQVCFLPFGPSTTTREPMQSFACMGLNLAGVQRGMLAAHDQASTMDVRFVRQSGPAPGPSPDPYVAGYHQKPGLRPPAPVGASLGRARGTEVPPLRRSGPRRQCQSLRNLGPIPV